MPTDAGRSHGLALLLAFVCGGAISIQSRMNGEMSSVLSAPAQAAVYSFGSGLALLLLAGLFSVHLRRGLARIVWTLWDGRLKWWQCLGGIGGGCFVAVQTSAVPLVGVAIFTVATVAGQTAAGLLVDRFGIGPGGKRPVRRARVAAAALAVVGVVVTVSDSFGDGGISVLPVLLAAAAGAGVAVQQGLNGRVNLATREVLATAAQNFLLGTVVLVVFMLIVWGRDGTGPVPFTGVPWWAWWGGVLGVPIIAVAAWAVLHVGVLLFGLALLGGQLGSAVLIDVVFPTPGQEVTAVMVLGVTVTLAAAGLAGWVARPRVSRAERDRMSA